MTSESNIPDPDRRTLPDRRKAEYDALDAKIDKRFDILTDRISRWIKKCIVGGAVLGLGCALGLLGLGLVVKLVQDQRLSVLVTSCQNTNERNKKTNEAIDNAILLLPEASRAKARTDSAPFRLIINATVPFTDDCDAYAHRRLKGERG